MMLRYVAMRCLPCDPIAAYHYLRLHEAYGGNSPVIKWVCHAATVCCYAILLRYDPIATYHSLPA